MSTIKFRRITEYGSLSDSGKNPQFNLVDWNGYEKYDIRRWDDTNTQPYKGITFDEEELEELLQALKIAVDAKKSTTPTKVVPCGSATAKIMDIFGFLPQYSDWAKLVTYTDWGYGAKYDLRSWAPDYSKCGKGITLGESECRRLIEILSDILGVEGTSVIAFADFVVRGTYFGCLSGHKTETITAQVNILKKDGSTETVNVTAGHCHTCGCYFMSETDYQALRARGILLCQVITEKDFKKNGNRIISGEDWKPESLLHQCGYNVNATDDLSDTQRHEILTYVVESGLQTVYQITNFLDWLIGQANRQMTRDMSSAIAKWSSDRKYISNYKMGSRRLVGVRSSRVKVKG